MRIVTMYNHLSHSTKQITNINDNFDPELESEVCGKFVAKTIALDERGIARKYAIFSKEIELVGLEAKGLKAQCWMDKVHKPRTGTS